MNKKTILFLEFPYLKPHGVFIEYLEYFLYLSEIKKDIEFFIFSKDKKIVNFVKNFIKEKYKVNDKIINKINFLYSQKDLLKLYSLRNNKLLTSYTSFKFNEFLKIFDEILITPTHKMYDDYGSQFLQKFLKKHSDPKIKWLLSDCPIHQSYGIPKEHQIHYNKPLAFHLWKKPKDPEEETFLLHLKWIEYENIDLSKYKEKNVIILDMWDKYKGFVNPDDFNNFTIINQGIPDVHSRYTHFLYYLDPKEYDESSRLLMEAKYFGKKIEILSQGLNGKDCTSFRWNQELKKFDIRNSIIKELT